MANKIHINWDSVTNPEDLCKILNALDKEVDELRTLANQVRSNKAEGRPNALCMTGAGLANATNTTTIKAASDAHFMVNGVLYKYPATDNSFILEAESTADISHPDFDVTETKFRYGLVCVGTDLDEHIIFGAEAADAAGAKTNRPGPDEIPDTYCVIGAFQIQAKSGKSFAGGSTVLNDGSIAVSYWDLAFHPDLNVQGVDPDITAAAVTEYTQRGR